MNALLETPALLAPAALLLCASLYYAAICIPAKWFAGSRARGKAGFDPAVSILKPIHGLTPSFHENIRSHALQDYPDFELLFGVADLGDPAVEPIRDLARQFPERRIELIVCGPAPDGNAKVYCLEKLTAQARHDTLVVNDGDISVGPEYLREVVAPLADPTVGMVTCLYRAKPGGTFWSRLEALWISAEFQAQVLLARALQGMEFGLGATMVFRRRDLLRIGGFESVRPYLADDYILGSRLAGLGLGIALSHYAVETALPAESALGVWRHLLRWSRTIRVSRPLGHTGLLVTHGTVWSAAALLAGSGNSLLLALAAACLLLRLAAAWLVGWGCVGSELVQKRLYLVPVADVLGFLVWCGSFFGNRVEWGGRAFQLNRRGEMLPADGTAPLTEQRRATGPSDRPGWAQRALEPPQTKET